MKNELKDNSGVDKIIVKNATLPTAKYQSRVLSNFLMPPTFMNLFMNLRKLGQMSSPFCILYECAKAR